MNRIKSVGWEALVMEALAPPPYGPGFEEGDLAGVEGLEIWEPDPGWGDYLEYRLVGRGEVVKARRLPRYW
jgi:hypothetical protein